MQVENQVSSSEGFESTFNLTFKCSQFPRNFQMAKESLGMKYEDKTEKIMLGRKSLYAIYFFEEQVTSWKREREGERGEGEIREKEGVEQWKTHQMSWRVKLREKIREGKLTKIEKWSKYRKIRY